MEDCTKFSKMNKVEQTKISHNGRLKCKTIYILFNLFVKESCYRYWKKIMKPRFCLDPKIEFLHNVSTCLLQQPVPIRRCLWAYYIISESSCGLNQSCLDKRLQTHTLHYQQLTVKRFIKIYYHGRKTGKQIHQF